MKINILSFFLLGFISCNSDSPDQILKKVEREYKKEYDTDLIMHRQRENYKGIEIYRLTGWPVEVDNKYLELNSDEWIIIFCSDKKPKVIKHTGFMPLDSISKIYNIECLPD